MSVSESNIKSGFRRNGIFPLDRFALDGPAEHLNVVLDNDTQATTTIIELFNSHVGQQEAITLF